MLLVPWTDIGAQSAVYLDVDFDQSTGMPAGWLTSGTTTTTSYNWSVFTGTTTYPVYSSPRCIRANSSSNPVGNTSVIMSPLVSITNPDTKLSFYVKNPIGGKLAVYVSTDSGATYVQNLLDSNLTAINDWTKKTYSLSQYFGQNVKIVFEATSNKVTNGYQFLDNIKVYETPTCAQPLNLRVSGITQNTAKISWSLDSEGDIPSQYLLTVQLDDGSYFIQNQVVTISTFTEYVISGLDPATNYHVNIKGDCTSASRGYSNLSSTISFTTLCNAVSLPQSFDFDSETVGEVPNCWNIIAPTTASAINSTKHNGESGNSLALVSTVDAQALATTTPIAHNGNDIQVDFYANTTTTGANLTVGLISDPFDFSSFEPIYSCELTANTWNNVRFNTFNSQQGTQQGLMIGFVVASGAATTIYLDDVTISAIPSCPRLEDFKVDLADSTFVKLSWLESVASNNYQVEVMNLSDTTVNYSIVNSNPAVINGLIPQTSYKFRVRSICSTNDTSEWSLSVVTTTACGSVNAPFFENFNSSSNLPDCWSTFCSKVGNGTSGSVFDGWTINSSSTYLRGGSGYSLKSPDSKKGTKYILNFPSINIPAGAEYELDFWMYRVSGNSSLNEGVKIYVNNQPTLTGAILLDSISRYAMKYPVEQNVNGYYEYFYNLPLTGVVYIIFESYHDYGSSIYIDDISVAPKQPCRFGIKNVRVNFDENTNDATVNWVSKSYETQWLVNYSVVNTTMDSVMYSGSQIVNDSNFVFNCSSYILSSSDYTVNAAVFVICGNDTSSQSVSASDNFTTPCGVLPIPYSQGFENTAFPPICWSAVTDSSSAAPTKVWARTTSYKNSGSAGAQFPDSKATTIGYLSTGMFNFEAGKRYIVSYYQRRYNYSSIKYHEGITVWVSTTPSDTTNALNLGFIPRQITLDPVVPTSGVFYEYEYVFSVPTTGQYCLIFQATQEFGSLNAIDDISVREAPSCMGILSSSVDVDANFHDKVVVSIKDSSIVQLGVAVCSAEKTSMATIDPTDVIIMPRIDNSYKVVIENLNPNTTYNLFFRNICDSANNVITEWTDEPISVTTLCEPVEVVGDSLIFFDGFEDYGTLTQITSDNSCYSVTNTSGTYQCYLKGGVGSSYSSTGTQCVPYEGEKQLITPYTNSPTIIRNLYLRAGVNYQISIYSRQNVDTHTGKSFLSFFYRNESSDSSVVMIKEDIDANSGEWTQYSAYFQVPVDGVYFVGFSNTQTASIPYIAFDNFRVREVNCTPPIRTEITAVGSNSVSMSNTTTTSQTEIRICTTRPSTEDINPDAVVVDTTSESNCTINGLVPNTSYYIITRSLCDNGGASEWSMPIMFVTNCEMVNIPYEVNFSDNIDTRCWQKSGSETAVLEYSTTRSVSAPGSMKIQGATAISPELNVTSLANMMITGWVYADQDSASAFSIGVCVDPNDVGYFETVAEVPVNANNEWVEFTAYFTALNDPDYADFYSSRYVTINCLSENIYYFDNLVITPIPTCPKPSNAVVDAVDAGEVTLQWNAGGSETNWNVQLYKVVNDVNYLVKDTTLDTTAVVFVDLEALTTYQCQVAALCSATDTSLYTVSNTVKTPCAPLSLPYSSKFNTTGAPDCWSIENVISNSTRKWTYSTSSKYFSTTFSTGAAADTAFLNTPEFKLNSSNGVIITLYARKSVSTDSIFTYVRYTTDGGLTYDSLPYNFIPYATTTQTLQTTIPNVGPGKIQFQFISEKHSSGSIFIYNLEVEEIDNCSRPDNVLFNVVNDTVNVTIVDNDSAHAQWDYIFDTADFDPTTREYQTTNSKTFALTNLSNAATYFLYVRSNCGSEVSSWYKPYNFYTSCGVATVPYSQNFENLTAKADVLDQCYTIYSTNTANPRGQLTTSYPRIYNIDSNTKYTMDGSKAIKLACCTTNSIFLYLPEIDVPVNNLNVGFNYINESTTTSNGFLVLGIMLPDDANSFVPVYTCPLASVDMAENRVNVALKNVLGNTSYPGYRVAFKYGPGGSTNYYLGIDNILVTGAEKCSDNPTISLNDATDSSIELSISAYADSVQVAYGTHGVDVQNYSNIINNAGNIELVDGLNSSMIYDFYIRQFCNNTPSEWFGPYTYATECDTVVVTEELPWIENFNDVDSAYQFPMCMHRVKSYTYNDVVYPYVVDTAITASASSLNMKRQNVVALPIFSDNPNAFKLSFYLKGTGSVEVGSIDKLNANNFVPVTSVNATNNATKVDLDLSLFIIDNYRLALRSDSEAMLYIDSLKVYKQQTCFDPRNLRVTDVNDIQATVNFLLSSLTEGYEYYLTSATDTVTGVVSGTADSLLFTNLEPLTPYQFGIRSYCSGNDTSNWSTINFTTARGILRAPFQLDFEDVTLHNKYLNFINSQYNKFIIGTNANAVKDGTRALYISRNNSAYSYDSSKTSVSYVVSTVEFVPGTYEISFDYKANGESSLDYLRVFLAPTTMQFTADVLYTGLTATAVPAGCVAIDGGSKLNLTPNWTHKNISLVASNSATMKLVFVWRNDASVGAQPPASIDNFICYKQPCDEYIDSIIPAILDNSASFRFVLPESLNDSVGYTLINGGGTLIASDTVDIAALGYVLTFNGLQSQTDYVLTVHGFCDAGATVKSNYSFTTICPPIVVSPTTPYVEDFESATTTTFATAFPCFDVVATSGTSNLTISSATSTTLGIKAYEGDRSVYLYYNNNRKMMYNTFNMSAGTCEISCYAISKGGLGILRYYYRAMGDSEWTLIKQFSTSEEHELKAAQLQIPTAGYYQIGIELDNTEMTTGYHGIDLIRINYPTVFTPSSLIIIDPGTTSAEAQWTSLNQTNRLLVYDKGSNDVIFDSLLINGVSSLTINGLSPSTDYYAAIRAENGSDYSNEIRVPFSTTCASIDGLYNNNFDNYTDLTRPNCWTMTSYTSAGADYTMSSTYAHWKVKLYGGEKAMYMYNSMATKGTVHNLYSPEIQLNSSAMLRFDYFNNVDNPAYTDSLVVTIISNGVESAPILTATYADMDEDYWNSFAYDLSPYVGTTIKVKFWTRASYYSSNKYVGIDNFKISCQTPGNHYYASVCPNTTYRGNGFVVEPTEVVMGDTTVINRVVEGRNGQCDTLMTLHLYVPSPSATVLYDTICEGEIYNRNGFSNLTVAGRYVHNGTSSLGCDSNVVLYLAVADVNHSINVNLCEGQTYNFAGQVISAAGVYRDTAVNSRGCDSITILNVTYTAKYYEETAYFCEGTSYTWIKNSQTYTAAGRYENAMTNAHGCDSIEVLNLIMLPTNVYLNVELCQGQSYEFFGNTITDAGTYTHSVLNSLNCDSNIVLTITSVAAPVTRVSDYVCEGQDYYGYGFTLTGIVSDTVVTNTVKTLEGCDSIVELTLDFIPTAHVAITATINEGETYEFGGNSLSQAGEYTHTYHTALGCDSIVTLTLIVTTPVDNAYALPIIVAPNPVVGGQSTFVNREWTAEEQNGMRVEVLNAVGQVVDVFTPATFPIEVGGIYTSGIYYIRVTSGTGEVYLGRLVVK